MTTLALRVPDKLGFLLGEQWRHKGAYGGRGGGKSWAFADSLLARAIQAPVRILCARELQNSIKDSVHRLLRDRIAFHGLEQAFDITDNAITGYNGSLFVFKGLRTNVNEVKSLEGIDLCWVEEAEKVSQDSIDVLIPTVRKEGSEIWWSWNTGTETDPVYRMLVSDSRPDSKVILLNYVDNPWFPDVLRKEMEHDKATDFEKYEHIWLGKPLKGGAFFTTFGPHLRERPFRIQPSDGQGHTFGSMDYGYGASGVTSYGQWYVDGNGLAHRCFTWLGVGLGTAGKQAGELVDYIRTFHWSDGLMPSCVWADPAMWSKTPDSSGAHPALCPADYFLEVGLPLIPANNNRVNGWQVMVDAFAPDRLTGIPKMRYFDGLNGALEETLPMLQHAKNIPGDVEKCEVDHVADECRYGLVGLLSRRTVATAERARGVGPRQFQNVIARHQRELEAAHVNSDTGWS